ncbi:hypothetical protein C8Q76DRAFT_861967 [Earliella scabrosa]|nr:hypothetical protein C8Q76DRAFT_863123 [Earliella scabrosa]KAI0694688.1 hypothetical protein C8Q76DRAFT_861967 [Earliella scabrosa]
MVHPAAQFVRLVLERNIAEVISSRSNATGPDAHNAWLAQAFSKVAFGHPSGMLGLDEFIAFRDGLNVKVPAKDKPQGVSLVASLASCIKRTQIPRLVVAMYNRRITDAATFLKEFITFKYTELSDPKGKKRATDSTQDSDPPSLRLCRIKEEVFVRRFTRYLTEGLGHPKFPGLQQSCGITAAEVEAQALSETLRATALLRAVTDSELLPAEPGWHIYIRFVHDNFDPKGSWFMIHTCTANIDIRFTPDLIGLLTTTLPKEPQAVTQFDAALHQLLWLAPMDYNKV